MTTKREARISAMMDGPAGPPAADVLAAGAAFTIIQVEGEEWDLVWFGQTLKPGPRCRRCSGLAHGSARRLTGSYAREKMIEWLNTRAADFSSAAEGP
jgi:hypothetical protein